MLAGGGVPVSCPVLVSKVAQSGTLEIAKVSASPSASEAVGVKTYVLPAITLVAGDPEICGAALLGFVGGPVMPEGELSGPPLTPTAPHAIRFKARETLRAPRRKRRNVSERD